MQLLDIFAVTSILARHRQIIYVREDILCTVFCFCFVEKLFSNTDIICFFFFFIVIGFKQKFCRYRQIRQ